MAFTVVRHLADTAESTLDQEANIASWLANIAEFTSQFFKRYHQTDPLGLVTFLLHRMRDENQFVLGYVLNSLLVKMFGWSDHVIN